MVDLDTTAKFNVLDEYRREVLIARTGVEQAQDDLERARNALVSATERLNKFLTPEQYAAVESAAEIANDW